MESGFKLPVLLPAQLGRWLPPWPFAHATVMLAAVQPPGCLLDRDSGRQGHRGDRKELAMSPLAEELVRRGCAWIWKLRLSKQVLTSLWPWTSHLGFLGLCFLLYTNKVRLPNTRSEGRPKEINQ